MSTLTHRIYITLFFVIAISSFLILAINGFGYYSTPLTERPFSELHNSLKPSGTLGHFLGIAGSIMMGVGVSSYMLRKRVRALFKFGTLKNWLEFHIFLCVTGPILVLFHTAFKFGGIVSISFWSMTAVVLSGIAGRFIYTQIPRSVKGNELDITEIKRLQNELSEKLKEDYNLDEKVIDKIDNLSSKILTQSNSTFTDFFKALGLKLKVNGEINRLKTELLQKQIPESLAIQICSTAKEKVMLDGRVKILKSMHALFRYWHIFHLPFAITMFVIMIIHIIAVLIFSF